MAGLTKVQVEKARDVIKSKMLEARDQFIADNSGVYVDLVLDADDVRVVKALAAKDKPGRDGYEYETDGDLAKNRDLAKLRMDFVTNGRSTTTLDLLTVKTEKDVPEENKFRMAPWLPAKRIRVDGTVWKRGYGDPELAYSAPTSNRFLDGAGGSWQALRTKGLFQLMTPAEIEDFAAKLDVGFDLYFGLFY